MESWKVSNELWEQVAPLIPKPKRDPARTYKRGIGGGRKPAPARNVFEAILFILRTGIQWKGLPQEAFGCSGSTVHRTFQFWQEVGFFEALWEKGLQTYDALSGIKWEWQSVDGSMRKAPMALEAVGANPTDRGKKREQDAHADGWCRSPAITRRNRSQPPRRG